MPQSTQHNKVTKIKQVKVHYTGTAILDATELIGVIKRERPLRVYFKNARNLRSGDVVPANGHNHIVSKVEKL